MACQNPFQCDGSLILHWHALGQKVMGDQSSGHFSVCEKDDRGHTTLASPPALRAEKSHFISQCAAAKNRGSDVPAGPGADGSENESHRAGRRL